MKHNFFEHPFSQIKDFIDQYGMSKEDVISWSRLSKQRSSLEGSGKFYDFPIWRKDYRSILKEIKQIGLQYKISWVERERFYILLEKAPKISNSNYNSIMNWEKKEKERKERERRERAESRERGWANLERIQQELHDAKFKKCPDCAEDVKKEARVCKHCGYRWE